MHIVTGGAGFIGSAIVSALNDRGIKDILVVDELGSGEKWRNLSNLAFSDYLHKDQFQKLFESDAIPTNTASVIHMGACSSTTERDGDFMMENNYRYSRTLAETCLKNHIRFVYASSAATYGDGQKGYSDSVDSLCDLRPLNLYGYSKQLTDLWALRSGALGKIAGIKFFNVFGPNEYHKEDMCSVVVKAYRQIKEKGSVNLFKSYNPDYGDGEQCRDFVYVKDCANAVCWLVENAGANGIFNLGSGKARTWKDLVTAVFAALKLTPQINYIEMPEELRDQYQYFTEADMNRLSAAGFKDEFHSLEDGVRDYVVNYLETKEPYL